MVLKVILERIILCCLVGCRFDSIGRLKGGSMMTDVRF
jgi:hypothetical protein